MAELQAWVTSEFGIRAEHQLLKSGIPPRVIVAPVDGTVLSLAHGDRVIVEVVGGGDQSPSAQGGPSSAASTSIASIESEIARHLYESQQSLSLDAGLRAMLGHLKRTGASVWAYAQENEWLFCCGGLFYAQMQRDVGLVDGKHCHLPLIPDKVFTYNAAHDRLELCFEPHGHFAIGPDVEAKIATGQVGSTGQHHHTSPTSPLAVATPAADSAMSEASASNTVDISLADTKSSSASTAKASRMTVRKGPGFTVLAPPSPEAKPETKPQVRPAVLVNNQSEEERALEQLRTVVSMLQDHNRVIANRSLDHSRSKEGNEDPGSMDTN